MPRWDETALRRPDFDPAGAPITLADGQSWIFRRPRLKYPVTIGPDGLPALTPKVFGPTADYGERLEALAEARGADVFPRTFALALELLRANYDLPDGAVPDLFVFDFEDEGDDSLAAALGRLVRGVAPKA